MKRTLRHCFVEELFLSAAVMGEARMSGRALKSLE